jgi:hypothetical protein
MFATDREFEDEVRRIARLLWRSAEFGGAQIVDDRERDGIFETEDFIVCIECTVSRQRDKAVDDAVKLDKLIRKLTPKHPAKFIKGWFITLHEPTADQRGVIAKYQGKIVTCSYDQFRAKLIDARSYITARGKYPFGSVRDPKSGSPIFDVRYVPLDILDEEGTPHDVESIASQLIGKRRIILTGDYGAGKSSTAREVYLNLARRFWEGKVTYFPVLLNLRDHHGQIDPVEAIERHARKIGFSAPSSLVRAWRAGYCTMILDGFDEIASAGWAGITKKLRDLRYRSMELIRVFIRETPPSNGLLITGRAHFFDSERELSQALNLTSNFRRLKLTEFTTEQVASFLQQLGWGKSVPEWLPTRPLLLAYLVSRGLLSQASEGGDSVSPAAGWHDLLDRISERESEIEAGIDPTTVRRLIETLATAARATTDGLGPLSPEIITNCFKAVCGYAPDDRGAVLLQRLPGLGGVSAEDGSRVFIDDDYAEAARSGDVFRYIEDPFISQLDCEPWQLSLRVLGVDIIAYRCQLAGYDYGKIGAALRAAYERQRGHTLATDILLCLMSLRICYEGPKIYLKEVIVDEILVEDEVCSMGTIEFQDTVVGRLELSSGAPAGNIPTFRRCHFAKIDGRTGERDLPSDRFIECTYDEFEHTSRTTRAILALHLPLTTKVMLTILKKLFAQSGSGRRESALYRGLDARAQEVVPGVLSLIKRHEFVVKTRQGTITVWLPAKTPGIRKRALSILATPNISKDPLIEASKQLSGGD